jgi:FkbM family methyltransferase
MSEARLKKIARGIFRWYLHSFPLRDGKVRLYEAWQRALLPPENFQVIALAPGFRLRCDLRDPEQRKMYFFQEYHERYEARLVRSVLPPGASFWDVGANIGYFTLLAATVVGPQGRVVAWEPGPEAFQQLQENIALNGMPQVWALPLAVAAQEGTARLYLHGAEADTGATLFPGGARSQSHEVQTTTLDAFFRQHGGPPPQLLKVDVEGAELAVLQGAARLLAEHSPLLLVEMEEKTLRLAGLSRQDIMDFLATLGYRGASLQKGRWHRLQEIKTVRGRNVFWFREDLPEHRRHLPALGLATPRP